MIKGDSRLPVVGAMAMCVQLLLIRYNIAVWFESVDSDSNLADGLSRALRSMSGFSGDATNRKASTWRFLPHCVSHAIGPDKIVVAMACKMPPLS